MLLLHASNGGHLTEIQKDKCESRLSMTSMAVLKLRLKVRSSPHLVPPACQLLLADMRRLVASHWRSHQ